MAMMNVAMSKGGAPVCGPPSLQPRKILSETDMVSVFSRRIAEELIRQAPLQ